MVYTIETNSLFKIFEKVDLIRSTEEKIANEYGQDYELAFANGGDQNNDIIPERPICEKMGIALIDGLGDKIQSSSWLLKKL